MKINIKIIGTIVLLGLCTFVYSRPKVDPRLNIHPPTPLMSSVIPTTQDTLDGNNIRAMFVNTGIMDINIATANTPGFEWPKGTGQDALFTSGYTTAAYVGGTLLMASAMYEGEYQPGYVALINGAPKYQTDSRFKIYKVSATDPHSAPDWQNWGNMVPFGAPFVDVNHDGIYEPNIDIPGIKDAAQTIFMCLTDANPSSHYPAEGFGGGTAPLFSELHIIAWCYNTPGLEDMQFVQYTQFNKNILPWKNCYTAMTTDPDLGCPNDDYLACDTIRNLAIDWNGEENDCTYTYQYQPPMPASGQSYFISPIVYTGNPNDQVIYYIPPGSDNKVVRIGWKQLHITAFGFFTNPGTPGPACERDPNPGPLLAYHYMQGTKSDASPWMIPPGNSASLVTKFVYTGDPESNTGWCEDGGTISGAVWNCGGPGHYSGDVHSPNVFGDRRFLICSGADNFTINPGDSNIVVIAQLVARGSNRKNSVTVIKKKADVSNKIFTNNFHVIPPPPPPVVHVSSSETSSRGTYALTLSWGDTSETYNYRDTIFGYPDTVVDSMKSYYRFQGYEVWEMDPNPAIQSPPDFSKPDADYSSMKLIAIFDRINNFGQIVDTFQTGNGVLGVFPVVPQYKFPAPQGFPHYGVTRSITLTSTQFPGSNNNANELIYGHNYRFLVTAYGRNTFQRYMGQAMIRNSLSSSILPIHIEAPLAGSQFFFRNGDTLYNSRRDLGVMPIVKAQEQLIDATYRIQFNDPDTTYNILRFINGPPVVVKSNLKFSYNPNGFAADDSSRIVDGIDFKVYKLLGIQPIDESDTGNIGVVHDPQGNPGRYQTRLPGWEYIPPQNQFLTGSKYIYNSILPWNSISMSLSYPHKLTYSGFKTLVKAEDLRKVQIVFTGYGSGQQAYRYLATSTISYAYQNMAEVPFKVYEIDSTDASPNPRQLNCAFLEFDTSLGGHPDGKWDPTADSLGGKEILYIFNSNYSPNADPFYTSKNLLLNQPQIDVMYVWAPKLYSPSSTFHTGDQFIIYPYMTTRPNIEPGHPLYYDVVSKKPILGNSGVAVANNDMNKITIVPNPYYGFSALETPTSGHFVTIRRLPANCTIKIYTLNGDLIRTFNKNDASTSELKWDMKTLSNVPVASGIYIILVDAPGIGQKVLKAAIFTVEERIDF